MKQLSFLEEEAKKPLQPQDHWKIFVDGAARNNPGPAGAGIYILKNDEFSQKYGFYLGQKTNNQAEYLALLLGLFLVKKQLHPLDCVHVISDSELLVKQLKGIYKIKNKELLPLHVLAKKWLQEIHGDIFHVFRFDNVHADEMANEGIDAKRKVPQEFLTTLAQYDISLS